VDIVFINAIMGLFEANEVNDAEEVSWGILKFIYLDFLDLMKNE
jgi:hypothetical protein